MDPGGSSRPRGLHVHQCYTFELSFRLGTGLGTEMLSLVKNLAVRLDMIPQTLASRARLKRALFGKMKTMPAVITETMAPYMAPMQIEGDGPNPQFSILFMVAKRNCLRSPVSEVCSRKVALSEAKRATTIEGVSSRPMRNMAELNFFRGRVALYGMLKALGVKRGDEVAMAAYTCVAVPEAVIALGARPVWIDLGPDALTMDPDHAEVVLKSSTRALIVQHTFGVAAQMERLVEIAARRGVPIIEDCCHTHRSTSRGQAVGSFGAGAFYSFEWGKPLVAGLGGAAVCHDPGMNRELVSLYSEFREVPLIRELRIALQYYAYQFGYRPSLYWVARRLNRLAIQLGLGEEGYHSLGDLEPSRDFLYRMARISRARLVHRINEIDVEELRFELVALTNRVLAADRVAPGDDEGVAAVLDRLVATLDLAIERLAQGDDARGAVALRTIPLVRLHRLGVSLCGKVKRLAVTLRRVGPLGPRGFKIAEADDAAVLDSVTQLRPLFPRILDEPPASGERPFESLADLARAGAAVEAAAAAQALVRGLGVTPDDLGPRGTMLEGTGIDEASLDLGVLARTALVRRLLDSRKAPKPPALAAAPPPFRPLEESEARDFEGLLGATKSGPPKLPLA